MATTACTTGRCAHTPCRTHTFSVAQFVCAHPHTSHACHTHAWLKVMKWCLSHECLCSLSRFLLSFVSPVSAVPVHPLLHPPFAGHPPLRTCIAKFGYPAKSDANTGCEPKKFDKITSVDSDTMLIDGPDFNE